jgi:Glycosyl transferase family 2
MTSASAPVCVSVLMPAYNAERYVLQSVQSVLAQTFEDFELLVVDDCSTDGTAGILSSVADRRLRVLRNEVNLGIVGTLNRAMAAARGRYIARTDADDFCLPTRFAEQTRYLDRHPKIVLVGTGVSTLEGGVIRPRGQLADPDPALLRWQLNVGNPMGHGSMMFRADAVAGLGAYLREAYRYAEDFDFTHRVMRLGEVAVLPERLIIYRLHQTNLTRTGQAEMIAKAAAVLSEAYATLLGGDRAAEATMVAEHLMAGVPVRDLSELERLGDLLERLAAAFVTANALDENRERRVVAHAGAAWWVAVQNALRAGIRVPAALGRGHVRFSGDSRPPLRQLARSAVAGLVDSDRRVSRWLRAGARIGGQAAPGTGFDLSGTRFEPLPIRGDDPPSLYAVIDAETGVDPSEAPGKSSAAVGATAAQERAQAIFDRFGLRPIYAVDYAIASQPEGYGPLRRILDRHACAIGAQLRPGINPPFDETAGAAHDPPSGVLPADLEARKLHALVAAIQQSFDVSPLFFKAGRDGFGPGTVETLARLGFAVDLSILPAAGVTVMGGADVRHADARPYRAAAGTMLSVPMTRAHLGPFAPLLPRAPDALAHLRLARTVALTPEGVTAEEQIRLIRSMIRRGYRTFMLHYHGPSLVPGSTPYVRTGADLKAFLKRIEAVCRFFVGDVGGMPGNPADLVPQGMRERIWPQPPGVAVGTLARPGGASRAPAPPCGA